MNKRQFHIFFNQDKNWHGIVCQFLFWPVFARCDHNIVLQIKTKQFSDHITQKLETGKNTKINKHFDVNFGLIKKNLELSHIYQAVIPRSIKHRRLECLLSQFRSLLCFFTKFRNYLTLLIMSAHKYIFRIKSTQYIILQHNDACRINVVSLVQWSESKQYNQVPFLRLSTLMEDPYSGKN